MYVSVSLNFMENSTLKLHSLFISFSLLDLIGITLTNFLLKDIFVDITPPWTDVSKLSLGWMLNWGINTI